MHGRPIRFTPTSVARAAACLGLAALVGVWSPTGGLSQQSARAATPPWMDASQTPAARAAEVMAAMTLDDKLSMLHNTTSCQYAGCAPSSFSGGCRRCTCRTARSAWATGSAMSRCCRHRWRALPAGTPP
jgi:hypothetical protein